jgi:hypothetical protein
VIRRLQLGRAYFAGKGGVHVVRQDGTEYDRAEGYQLIFDAWPKSVEGDVVDSRGHLITVIADQMRRVAEDKVYG